MKQQLQQRFKRFFGERMPRGPSVILNQRSTYIWPTALGYFLIGILVLMLIGATNYQNNLAFLLTFLLVGLGLVSIVLTFKNMQGIRYTFLPGEEVFANEEISLHLSLHSEDSREHFTIGIGSQLSDLKLLDIKANGFTQAVCRFPAMHRGWQYLPRLMVSSQFPFGWLRTWGYFSHNEPLLVFPQPIEPPAISAQYSGQENEEGMRGDGSEDLYGLKPYQDGEPLTRVDWKSYARERGMFIREFTSYQGQDLTFSWHDFVGEPDEKRLSYLCYLVLDAAARNQTYALVLPASTIGPDDGAKHRLACLTGLASYNQEKPENLPGNMKSDRSPVADTKPKSRSVQSE